MNKLIFKDFLKTKNKKIIDCTNFLPSTKSLYFPLVRESVLLYTDLLYSVQVRGGGPQLLGERQPGQCGQQVVLYTDLLYR